MAAHETDRFPSINDADAIFIEGQGDAGITLDDVFSPLQNLIIYCRPRSESESRGMHDQSEVKQEVKSEIKQESAGGK
jgi:sugar (pentulose or hexulose) kinase